MSLWKIAWRSIQQRALASSLTGISMGLGVALVVAVLVVRALIGDAFRNNAALGYNMIVGAKGGKLQLVLNTVYYLSSPVENIPYSYYKEFSEGKYKAYVEKAVPCCLGDYFDRYRVIGTTPDMFALQLADGRNYHCASGKIFDPKEYFTGVIGATVARETGLKVGSKFSPTHGAPDGHQHDPFTVVGVLAPTGTPNDRALFVNIEGFYLLENHARPSGDEPASAHGEHAHDEHADHDHDHAHEDEHAEHEHDEAMHDEHDHDHADHDHEHAAEGEHADHDHDHAAEGEHADHDHDHAAEADPAAMTETGEPADHDHADHEHAAGEPADHDHEHGEHDHEHADHDHDHADHDHDHAGHDHGHHHHHEPLPESQREVTAVLLLTSTPVPGMEALRDANALNLIKQVNKGQVAQAVLPIREIRGLFDLFVEPIELVLLGLTVLIVVVAGIGILVSIYNSMSERRHEIAVMRALGAGRSTVMLIVLLESIVLSLAGGLAGWFLGHLLLAALNPWIVAQTGVSIGFFQSVPGELVIIPGLIVLASIVGYLPATVAYRTDVAKALSAAP